MCPNEGTPALLAALTGGSCGAHGRSGPGHGRRPVRARRCCGESATGSRRTCGGRAACAGRGVSGGVGRPHGGPCRAWVAAVFCTPPVRGRCPNPRSSRGPSGSRAAGCHGLPGQGTGAWLAVGLAGSPPVPVANPVHLSDGAEILGRFGAKKWAAPDAAGEMAVMPWLGWGDGCRASRIRLAPAGLRWVGSTAPRPATGMGGGWGFETVQGERRRMGEEETWGRAGKRNLKGTVKFKAGDGGVNP